MAVFHCMSALALLFTASQASKELSQDVNSITFLVTVNDTWKWDPPIENDTCMVTVKTFPLSPNTPLNKSENIMVGNCDNGPLVFSVNPDGQGKSSVFLTFHSSVVLDASPPTCTIQWDYSYLTPTHHPSSPSDSLESLLPGCFTADSREGYHMTNYWFYIIDWSLGGQDHGSSIPHDKQLLKNPSAVSSVSFLVAVNQTEVNCIATSKTPPLQPGKVHNKTEYIYVKKCDYGTLDFNITTAGDGTGATVDIVFHSHDIEDASPPMCKISWDYSYKVPSENNYQSSLLPGCFTSESREGFHMTYYWFYILDWSFGLE